MRIGRVGFLTAAMLLSATPASAHAESADVSPAPCSQLDHVDEVRLEFSTELDPEGTMASASIDGAVIASAGVDLSDLDHGRITLRLPTAIEGTVHVDWHNTSAIDNDESSGSYAFSVGAPIGDADCEISEGDGEDGGRSLTPFLPAAFVALLVVVGISSRHASRRPEKSPR